MASVAPRHTNVHHSECAPLPRNGLAHVPLSGVTHAHQAWRDLARCAAEPNPFLESWSLEPSLEWLGRDGEVSLLCFMRDGMLCGLMPIARQRHYAGWPIAHLSNWLHPNMFLGTPLIRQGSEADYWRAMLDWADASAGAALFLHLDKMGLDGPVHGALRSVLATDGRAWGIVQSHDRAILSSDLEPETYLASSLTARKRKDLDRRYRRLCEVGEVEFRWEEGTAGLAEWIDRFLALEASGWKGAAGSALVCDTATEAIFRASLEGAGQSGRLVRVSLRLDGRPIAMLSTFLTPPGAFGYKTAFDESYDRYSPGILLEREYVAVLKRLNIEWCDSCAAPDHSVMNEIWRERRPIGRISIAVGGHVRRAVFSGLLRMETWRGFRREAA